MGGGCLGSRGSQIEGRGHDADGSGWPEWMWEAVRAIKNSSLNRQLRPGIKDTPSIDPVDLFVKGHRRLQRPLFTIGPGLRGGLRSGEQQ